MAGEFWRIMAVRNAWNLRCRKSNHAELGVITEYNIEVVEVPSRSAENQDALDG